MCRHIWFCMSKLAEPYLCQYRRPTLRQIRPSFSTTEFVGICAAFLSVICFLLEFCRNFILLRKWMQLAPWFCTPGWRGYIVTPRKYTYFPPTFHWRLAPLALATASSTQCLMMLSSLRRMLSPEKDTLPASSHERSSSVVMSSAGPPPLATTTSDIDLPDFDNDVDQPIDQWH